MNLLLAAMLATACAACGDDELSPAELAARADAICERYDAETRALGPLDLEDAEASAVYLERAADLAGHQQEELEGLMPPEAARADYERLLDATGEARAVLAGAARDRPDRAELLRSIEPLAAGIDAAAVAVGARKCGG